METREVPKLELLWRELAAVEKQLRIAVMATTRVRKLLALSAGIVEQKFNAVLNKVQARANYNLKLRDFIDTFELQVGFPCEVVERVRSEKDPRFTVAKVHRIGRKRTLIKFVKRMLFLGRRIAVLPDVKGKTKVMWV